ncbi:phosphoribosylformylglycinamidine synthase [Arcanobacterium bovis]|uniref:Phosphoribosylformylglycinamidine synthase n=1 Tax=Arcanobacterium bovis TaxID=2529275 RepID=A0A4Q9V0R8_9ACTO|nr:phosphoribosylformylglycinamidine synthase [Arcanobacterium bovis]TBW22234.1 phosphoribosylformylglycinamidine synthase [Arcanobacterium bovis]
MDKRLLIRRKPSFRAEERALTQTLNTLSGVSVRDLAAYNVYDVFNATEAEIAKLTASVLRDPRVDDVVPTESLAELLHRPHLGVQFLPGQYDQRADAATQALGLVSPGTLAQIFSAHLYVFNEDLSSEALETITAHLINPVEAGKKNFDELVLPPISQIKPLAEFPDFLELDNAQLEELRQARSMAMSLEDLALIQEYFRTEQRVPTEVELAALDTYWSDHCRHTTFGTELIEIRNDSARFAANFDRLLQRWDELRGNCGRENKPRTLMDLGTIAARDMRRRGDLDSQEVSEEINACSVFVDVKTAHGKEPWLLMFKNETHNHPTEIEPFGGASTCLGGAIRDPLSGRSWVYQALRLSSAGDITTAREHTLEGKLPQRDISTRATAGYSSYGNQIGLATTHVREYVHPGYTAKRMELGAVVAAAPVENVRREEPRPGDVVIILGGRTGRDGIGGATGSSKAHDEESLETSGAEVQKGNPVNERKIQRLFRRGDVAKLIRRCNDFGAGGVAVAVGELADSLDIHLDQVPLKYAGLNPLEIAISESQERMAVVVDSADAQAFIDAAAQENLEAVTLAEVTDTGRLRMFYGEEKVLDLSRDFLNTNGAHRTQQVVLRDPKPVEADDAAASSEPSCGCDCACAAPPQLDRETVLEVLRQLNNGSQEGMIEQFDSSIGRSTVLMPYGGKSQKSAEDVSVQTLPVPGGTSTASLMAAGYSPELADDSPYLMGAYSVVEALARLAAAGADVTEAWLTVQEYFQRPTTPEVWGVPVQALLGLLEAQDEFNVGAIGGKDSMSGSYSDELHVPPTLVSFAVAVADAEEVLSATLPAQELDLYLLPHDARADGSPNYSQLRAHFAALRTWNTLGLIRSARAVTSGGTLSALVKSALGNNVGIELDAGALAEHDLLNTALGSIVVAVPHGTTLPDAGIDVTLAFLGTTNTDVTGIKLGDELVEYTQAQDALESGYRQVFPINAHEAAELPAFARELKAHEVEKTAAGGTQEALTPQRPVHVLLPVFPGTNSEYDTAEAFEAAGATTEFHVIRNITSDLLLQDTASFIDKLRHADILAISGGFSLGDEPDGSAKFIANFLTSPDVAAAVKDFVARDCLVLGICNGFQALVKSGFLPYGDPAQLTESSPTLTHNAQLRHVSRIATTRVSTVKSPWLASFEFGDLHRIPVSHGEGRFAVDETTARELFAAGQVAFQYVDADEVPTACAPDNPNGSAYAIEGIISPDGRILGKMGHPERFRPGLMKNIPEIAIQDIFGNAVRYCASRVRAGDQD